MDGAKETDRVLLVASALFILSEIALRPHCLECDGFIAVID